MIYDGHVDRFYLPLPFCIPFGKSKIKHERLSMITLTLPYSEMALPVRLLKMNFYKSVLCKLQSERKNRLPRLLLTWRCAITRSEVNENAKKLISMFTLGKSYVLGNKFVFKKYVTERDKGDMYMRE